MTEAEKTSRRKQCILNAVSEALEEYDYSHLTVEDIAARAGVGKSTIYRWWKHKSDLVLDAFKEQTAPVFALNHPVGRALLVVMAEHREAAGEFFKQYLLPRREQMRKLIQVAIERHEIIAEYPFELMLDTLYGPIHYQIIFFNRIPDQTYIEHLVSLVMQPILVQNSP